MSLPFKITSQKELESYTQEEILAGEVFLVDKPYTWTSFQAVNKLKHYFLKKYQLKKLKIGHAGTLDPLATGLLIICTGKFTKKIDTFQALPKVYTGTFELGATTPSYDLETAIHARYDYSKVSTEDLAKAVKQLTGVQEQLPPIFSAIKVDGVRAYKKARKGESLEIKKRSIEVSSFELTRVDLPEVDFKIICSKGTYIRSIAHDFGTILSCGAHLKSLRRCAIGTYQLAD